MTDICDECGQEFEKIGRHWGTFESHRPSLSNESLDMLTGVLMGDGTLNKGPKNAYVDIKMTTPDYLEYIHGKIGDESLGVKHVATPEELAARNRKRGFRPNADAKDYSHAYQLKTRCNPQLNRFRSWYCPNKVWPADIELTPTVLKHLYCCDGHWDTHDSHSEISIAALNEQGNKEKINSYFSNVGLPTPDRYESRKSNFIFAWNVDGTQELFEYMGEPLPGFGYKFP